MEAGKVIQGRCVTAAEIGLSALSVFFTQSPSFLAHQKTMEQNKGQSNAQTLFQVDTTPSDNHIIPPRPEFIVPQDGNNKQDCEINYQWLELLEAGTGIHTMKLRVKNKKKHWEQHTYSASRNARNRPENVRVHRSEHEKTVSGTVVRP